MTVENPGAEDTPVDMEKLKASLSCPLCNDMYRFPVTVVSAHSTISGGRPRQSAPPAPEIASRPSTTRLTSSPLFARLSDGVPAHVLPRV